MPPAEVKAKSRYEKGFYRRLELLSKLREAITEEDVNKFYLNLMQGVDDKNPDAMKMFLKIIHPDKEEIDTGDKKPQLPTISKEAAAMLDEIAQRYGKGKVKHVVLTQHPAIIDATPRVGDQAGGGLVQPDHDPGGPDDDGA